MKKLEAIYKDWGLFLKLLNTRSMDLLKDNKFISPNDFTSHQIEDNGIEFNVKLFNSDKINQTKPDGKFNSGEDPFEGPFAKDEIIDSITSTHNLILNKYPLCSRHSIIATKEWEE